MLFKPFDGPAGLFKRKGKCLRSEPVDIAAFTAPSGDVIERLDRDARRYWCFVPDPLPPSLAPEHFVSLLPLMADASRALGRLAGLGTLLRNPALLVRPYMRREAIASSRIENTYTSFAELIAFEAGAHRLGSIETREVHNYVLALEYGLRHVGDHGVTPDLIREIHRLLMRGGRGESYATPGEFRSLQNHIGGTSTHPADARFVPPPPTEALALVDQLVEYLSARKPDTPALVEAAWMHYQFESIHPFLDGNGRVGRVLIPLLLSLRSELEHPLLYLSPYFERDRSRYYDLLLGVSTQSLWIPWLAFFLQGVVDQSNAGASLAKQIIDLGRDWHERLEHMGSPLTAHRLADYVHEVVGVYAATLHRALGVSQPTAYKAIATLVDAGILHEVTGRSRGQIFVATELQRILEQGI
jgi:Fic family protein